VPFHGRLAIKVSNEIRVEIRPGPYGAVWYYIFDEGMSVRLETEDEVRAVIKALERLLQAVDR